MIGTRSASTGISSLMLFLFLFCAFSILSYSTHVSGEEARREQLVVLSRGTEPELIETVKPEYPKSALRRGSEGWVLLLMDVDEQGRVVEPLVLDSSNEGKLAEAFRVSARDSVAQWRFKPAEADGKPIYRDNFIRMFLFKLSDTAGEMTRPFYGQYRRVADALDEDDLEEARKQLDRMKSRDMNLLAEHAYYLMLETMYLEKAGDKKAMLNQLERALNLADDAAQDTAYAQLLRMSVVHHAQAHNLYKSLESYASLQEVDEDLSSEDGIHQIAARVRAFLEGDQPIVTEGTIAECSLCRMPTWGFRHALNRHRFMVELMQGDIELLRLNCGPVFVDLEWSENVVFNLENDPEDCALYVSGSQGTQLELIELPD